MNVIQNAAVLRDEYGIRRLTLREALDFQGFSNEFYFPKSISSADAFRQIGNSVSVPVIRRIAEQIVALFGKVDSYYYNVPTFSVRSPEVTYKIMSAVKSSDTKPEVMLREELFSRGLRYRKNVKTLAGKPDIVFPRSRLVIYCDGDFWHGHNWAIRGFSSLEDELSRYSEYWRSKILTNIERDKKNNAVLEAAGWTVLRFWESDIKADVKACADVIERVYREESR
jgi:DNA mismatch endonuclease (patch repair protein)